MEEKLHLFLDMRTDHDEPFDTFYKTIPRHFGELLAMARIANKEIWVSFHLIYPSSAETLFSSVPLHRDDDALTRILGQLEDVWNGRCNKPNMKTTSISSTSAIVSYVHHICGLDSGGSAHLIIIFASLCIELSDIFLNFIDFTLDSSYELHCITVRMDTICMSCSMMGTHGRLYRCPSDPYNIKAAVQMILEKPLLGVVPLRVNLKMGSLFFECEAQRACLSILPRCITMESFTHARDDNPDLIFQGSRFVHSALEQRRCPSVEAPILLTVEASVKPEHVDDTLVHGDTWILSNASKSAAHLIPAACADDSSMFPSLEDINDVWSNDVLVCSTTSANFDPPHQLALQKSCFLVYAFDFNKLLMRAIMPTEIRRVILPFERPLPQRSATLRNKLLAAYDTFKQRGMRYNFSIDIVSQGDLCQIISQLKTEQKRHVEVFTLPQ